MFRLFILLALLTSASVTFSQGIIRPPLPVCSELDLFYCELFNLNPCPCSGPDEIRRVAPLGPTYDMWLGNYALPRAVGVTQIAYEPEPVSPRRLAHATSYEILDEVASRGFGGLKLWMDAVPFEGMGEWCWRTYYDVELCANYTTEDLDLERFWESLPDGFVLTLRPQSTAWSWSEATPCMDGGQPGVQMALADYYAIASRLYELIGDRKVTVILTDWEQDWISCYEPWGQDFVLRILDHRQADIERARREAFLERGHRPKLRVTHAVVLNKNPWNAPDWPYPYLAERLKELERQPDYAGISYWHTGVDPAEILDWYRQATAYPKHRMYIDEFGGEESRQVQRFNDYLPAFRAWGINLINVWMWKQTWCDSRNLGLWKQSQPCVGKVTFTEPTEGYYTLEDFNVR